MNQDLFIDSYLEKINDRFGFDKNSGHAFEIFALSAVLDKPFDEVYADISTLVKTANGGHEGGNDGGVDGVCFDEDTATLAVFQTKCSQNIGDNEITKFIADYENLFNYMNRSQLPLNKNIKAKLDDIWDKPRQGITYTPKLFFVFRGKKEAQNKAIADRHEAANPMLKILDSEDLFAKIQNLRETQNRRKTVEFTFNAEKSNIASSSDPQALITYAKGNIRSVGFRLNAKELCKLINKEKEVNGSDDHLYGQNVRGFLGAIRTNRQIKETLMGNNPEYFPFLNNGITMIAERLKLPNSMQADMYPIQTVNPVIVNGLQSTRVIYEVYEQHPEKLDDVDVMIRLYDANDDELASKITTATNTQTLINVTDKMSNKDFNANTKTLFENKGIGYLNKRGESFENKLSRELKATIASEVLLKFWYATYFEKPETAKSSKATVLQQIYDAANDTTHLLHPLFSGAIDSPIYLQLLNVYYIYQYVIDQRNSLSENGPDFIQHSDELLSYGIYKYLGLENDNIQVDKSKFNEAYNHVFDLLIKITDEEKLRLGNAGLTYSHNNYFKKPKSHLDLNAAANWVESAWSESMS